MIQAIVFDMDDTLYPERDFVLSGFRAVAQWASHELGIPFEQGYKELRHLFEQGIRGDTFNRWLTSRGIEEIDGTIKIMIQTYRQHKPEIEPFPGINSLLKKLQATYLLGLVSDGYLDVQKRKLDALNIAQYLDAIVFSDEWGSSSWKPSTKPFQAICHRLQVDPCRAAYIADNPIKDFLGARTVGMKTIWIKRLNGEYSNQTPPTTDHTPDVVISKLTELPKNI